MTLVAERARREAERARREAERARREAERAWIAGRWGVITAIVAINSSTVVVPVTRAS